jgi:hypothetical protein
MYKALPIPVWFQCRSFSTLLQEKSSTVLKPLRHHNDVVANTVLMVISLQSFSLHASAGHRGLEMIL